MKHFLFSLLIIVSVLSACKKSSSPSNSNVTSTADQYVGTWRFYDSVESTGIVYQKDFTIVKVGSDRILILDMPYTKDSIFLFTAPTVKTDTDNLKYPIYLAGFSNFTSTRFEFYHDVFTATDYYRHDGYAIKK
jgi:hypothetical protein